MKYTKNHEWIKVEAKIAIVGISKYASKQLGDITFVELPLLNKTIKKGEILCEIESVKAASDVYSPVSGTIIEVNKRLEEEPEIINSAPETDGWICRIEISDVKELENLLDKTAYTEYLKTFE